MDDSPDHPRPEAAQGEGKTVDAAFRNGSLTAIKVVAGFSLSFLAL